MVNLDKNENKISEMFDGLADSYDEMNNKISLGTQKKWRMQSLQMVTIPKKANILDVATGTGDVVIELANSTNNEATIYGIDISEGMLKVAKEKIKQLNPDDAKKITLIHGSALELPFPDNNFDLVTISFGLRNMPSYQKALEEMYRVLKPGGKLIILEMSQVDNPIIKPFWKFYMNHIVPKIGGNIGKREDYDYLNKSAQNFISKKELVKLMVQVGFDPDYITIRTFNFGAVATHIGTKK
jgi:demethylmenaquinone methyltransferase/2-methoxy-6-polyprenyl-1,4-benzoquinol methylase